MDWQPIETAPKLESVGARHMCDVWAHTYELADPTTGRARKVSRRFTDARRTVVSDAFGIATESNPLSWRVVIEAAGLNTSWKVTHWMPLPEPPNA